VTAAVIVDTGPLVALLVRSDPHHEWAKHEFGRILQPMLTCEAVLAETAYLIGRAGGSPDFIFAAMGSGRLLCPFRLDTEVGAVQSLMARYSDLPMSLADACLVRMAELNADSPVLTLDADFSVYRKHGRRAIPLITPRR
jgi:uncharacterized protein